MLVGQSDAPVSCSYPFVAVEALSTSVIRVPTRTLDGPVMFVTELRFCETRCSTKSSRGVGVETDAVESAEIVTWYCRVVPYAAAFRATTAVQYTSVHAPAASVPIEIVGASRSERY